MTSSNYSFENPLAYSTFDSDFLIPDTHALTSDATPTLQQVQQGQQVLMVTQVPAETIDTPDTASYISSFRKGENHTKVRIRYLKGY